MDEVFLRIQREIRDLKQSRQRSSATIATTTEQRSVNISVAPDGNLSVGKTVFKITNLEENPLLFDVRFLISELKQLLPENGNLDYLTWVDEDDPLSYFVQISATVYQNNYSATVNFKVKIVATGLFKIEETT